MACKYLSADITDVIITAAERYLHRKLITKKQRLFPDSVCIFDQFSTDGDPDQFILIFDIKFNYQGVKTAIIRYYQIPLQLQRHGLGTKIYQVLEDEFVKLGCQQIFLEAVAEEHDNNQNAIGFWERLSFKKTLYCYPDNEICPMVKKL
ncbi:GNAT family N-acetyltransferase [Peptococcaceae bacterium 1198_IL3148]